jgi:hypothetical protein
MSRSLLSRGRNFAEIDGDFQDLGRKAHAETRLIPIAGICCCRDIGDRFHVDQRQARNRTKETALLSMNPYALSCTSYFGNRSSCVSWQSYTPKCDDRLYAGQKYRPGNPSAVRPFAHPGIDSGSNVIVCCQRDGQGRYPVLPDERVTCRSSGNMNG